MNYLYEEENKELQAWKKVAQAEILKSDREKKTLEAKLQKSEREKISNFKTFYLEREEMAEKLRKAEEEKTEMLRKV